MAAFKFALDDFVDGDVYLPGIDNPHPEYRRPKPWATREAKQRGANALVRFLAAGCPENRFTKAAYDALYQHMFGHIAHYDRWGFYGTWFSTPERRADWVEYALRGGQWGFHNSDRPDLWGDVERLVVGWLKSSGVGDRLIEAGRQHTEDTERAEYARLQEKYG